MHSMKTLKTHLVSLVLLSGIAFATYGNFQLRRENEKLNDEANRLVVTPQQSQEILAYESIASEIEGQSLSIAVLSLRSERMRQLRSLIRSTPFSLLIAAPKGSCTPCLNMALDRLRDLRDTTKTLVIPPVYVISERSRDGINRAVHRYMESSSQGLFVDTTGLMQKDLRLSENVTIAILVNSEGSIIYSHIVDYKYSDAFDKFLAKVFRFTSGKTG
jgi:hypothetical protein